MRRLELSPVEISSRQTLQRFRIVLVRAERQRLAHPLDRFLMLACLLRQYGEQVQRRRASWCKPEALAVAGFGRSSASRSMVRQAFPEKLSDLSVKQPRLGHG